MHILATQIATLEEAESAVDLAQSPADVVVMSFSDSDLSALAAAWEADGALPSLRLADLKRLKHPMSVDLYIDRVIVHAKAVVLRCLGGVEYWPYGLERIGMVARARGILLAALPGDDRPDPRLAEFSTLQPDALERLDRYFRNGGAANLRQALRYMASLLGRPMTAEEPQELGPILRFHADGRVCGLHHANDADLRAVGGAATEGSHRQGSGVRNAGNHGLASPPHDSPSIRGKPSAERLADNEPSQISHNLPDAQERGTSPTQHGYIGKAAEEAWSGVSGRGDDAAPHPGVSPRVAAEEDGSPGRPSIEEEGFPFTGATENSTPDKNSRPDRGRPVALVIFYRALVMAGDTAPISALMDALDREGLAPVAVALSSLKDPTVAADLQYLIASRRPKVILNTTAFSAVRDDGTTVLDGADVPVLQVVLAGSSHKAWAGSMRGLSAADQAMHVVLPELDGRLLTRAISFKEESAAHPALEYACIRHQPDAGRIAYVAALAAAWARLGEKPRHERRIAMILSDYPARAGRAGYAVGLDTAQSVAQITALLRREGFDVAGVSAAEVEAMLRACTHTSVAGRIGSADDGNAAEDGARNLRSMEGESLHPGSYMGVGGAGALPSSEDPARARHRYDVVGCGWGRDATQTTPLLLNTRLREGEGDGAAHIEAMLLPAPRACRARAGQAIDSDAVESIATNAGGARTADSDIAANAASIEDTLLSNDRPREDRAHLDRKDVVQTAALPPSPGYDVGSDVNASDVEGLLPANNPSYENRADRKASLDIAEAFTQIAAPLQSPVPGIGSNVSTEGADNIHSADPCHARRANVVGLDTAESIARIAPSLNSPDPNVTTALSAAHIEAQISDMRCDLMRDQTNGGDLGPTPTFDDLTIPIRVYEQWLGALPAELRDQIIRVWGAPAGDPAVSADAFHFHVLRAGKLVIALQPDRGAMADRKTGYHDAAIPPRHAYLAFYAWLRHVAQIDALIHLGTHGTLEWLPGKALALSETCWPEATLGPVPVIYPFIVNNPGEAVQAKRRIGAVTIGHLTPPLRKAGLHGSLAELENLVEEYAVADGLDRRRVSTLEQAIMNAAHACGFAAECGLAPADAGRDAIARLDARLCDIKELSIRDSFHVFARMPSEPDRQALASAMEKATPAGLDPAEREWSRQAIAISAECEGEALIRALDGRRVPPGPAGAPTRGRLDVLPTGRNLTSMDPRAIPTRTAAAIGKLAADAVIRRHLQDHGDYPRALILTLWASASLRTGGDDLAQALHYLGAVPVWDAMSNRVIGVEILPLAGLGRPRIDVTLRISGLFRDLFETQIALFDLAVRQVAARDEDIADNPVAEASRRGDDLARIFGGAPGSYGAGVASVALDVPWTSRADLGRAALANVTHHYGPGPAKAVRHDGFSARLATSSAIVQPQDTAERDVLDGDDVADFTGGMAAAAALLGASPSLYHLDTSQPLAPRARTMTESVAQVVRGRLTNPQWLAGMLEHGHRGVGEIAQSVDALYAIAATAEAVSPHLFEAVHEAVIADEAVFAAMVTRNPSAAGAIAVRLQDALVRGMWTSRRNAVAEELSLAVARCAAAERPVREAAE